jgi:hypothetical protein
MNSRRSLAGMVALVFAVSCVSTSVRAAHEVDPSGTWTWVRELEGQEGQSVLRLSYKNGTLTGTYKRSGQAVPISHARLDKNELSFEADGKWNDQKVHGKFKGKLSRNAATGNDEINGSIEIVVEDGSIPLAWVAKRGVDADDIVGTWKLKLVTPNGQTIEPQLKLSLDEGILKGTYISTRFGEHEAKALKLDGPNLSWTIEFERDGQMVKGTYHARLEASAAKGTIKGTLAVDAGGNNQSLEFSGERLSPKTVAVKKEGKKETPPQ